MNSTESLWRSPSGGARRSSGLALILFSLSGAGLLASPRGFAEEPARIVCPEIQPYCYRNGAEPLGFVYELGEEILRRLGRNTSIEIQPLARAQHSLREGKGTIALWLGRIPEREKSVTWIVPISNDAFHVFTLKGKPDASTLERAKELKVLAATISGANYVAAKRLELGHLETTASEEANGRKLLAGRVDGWISTRAVAGSFALRHKLGPDQIVQGVKLADFTAYIVASPDVDEKTVADWRKAYESTVRDGFAKRVMNKYGIPER